MAQDLWGGGERSQEQCQDRFGNIWMAVDKSIISQLEGAKVSRMSQAYGTVKLSVMEIVQFAVNCTFKCSFSHEPVVIKPNQTSSCCRSICYLMDVQKNIHRNLGRVILFLEGHIDQYLFPGSLNQISFRWADRRAPEDYSQRIFVQERHCLERIS